MGELHAGQLRSLVLATLLVVGTSTASAQQAETAPPPPPSNFELRLQEHQARQAKRKEALAERTESRLRKLTGSGSAAGTSGATDTPVGMLDIGLPVKAAIAAVIGIAASTAFGNDAADEEEGGSAGSGGATISTTSTN